MLERDRQKVPFSSFDWDRPKPLVEAILEGARRVWVISDTHLFHVRLWEVLRPTAEGGRDPRNTALILEGWRRRVRLEDLVLHMGDVVLGIPVTDYRQRIGWLPGEVWLLPGNHDRTPEKLAIYREMGWHLVRPFELELSGWQVRFTHEPIQPEELKDGEINIHGHIHHNPAYTDRHVNCSVEWLGYEPVDLGPILEKATRRPAPVTAARRQSRRHHPKR